MIRVNSKVTILDDRTLRIPDVSDEDYFGDKYSYFVSNSSLKHLNPDEGGSAYSYQNKSKKSTNSLELGTAVHRAVLEGDKFVLSEVQKPTGKLAEVVELAHKFHTQGGNGAYSDHMLDAMLELKYYGKSLTVARSDAAMDDGREYFDFLCSIDNDGDKIVLLADQREKFLKAIESIKANKDIQNLLNPVDGIFNVLSFSEDVITSEVEVDFRDYWKETGGVKLSTQLIIPIKAKIDNWSIDFDNKVITLNDLKTSSRPIQEFMGKWVAIAKPIFMDVEKIDNNIEFVNGSFQKWHYHRQMHMYAWMLASHCKNEYNIGDSEFDNEWTVNVNMIVAETVAPYNAYVFKVHKGWLDAGRLELDHLLTRVAWHEMYGWDKYIEFEELERADGRTINQGY